MFAIKEVILMESDKPFVADKLDELSKCASRHTKLSSDEWYIGHFKKDDIQFSQGRNLNNELENYMYERLEDELNHTNKTIRPIKEVFTDNVILNQGIQESIDRDIGVSSTELDYNSLGTSSTAELVTQTDLGTELTDSAYARKQFSVAGTRTRSSQTMILAMLWDDTSLDSPPTTVKESGVHWHLSDASKCHARAVFSDFTIDSGDVLVVRITELQQNGTL